MVVLPKAWGAKQWLFAGQDPVSLTQLGLRSVITSERLNAELKGALDSKDKYLADSVIELARQEQRSLDPVLLERHRNETGGLVAPLERLVQGLWDGKCSSIEGFAASKLSDLLVIGDVRDLYNEVDKYRNGKETDDLVIGLAAFGIVSTAAVPIHIAASTIKGLAKAGRLSPLFHNELKTALKQGLDTRAIVEAVPKFSWWDSLPGIGWQDWHPDLSWPLVTEKLPQLVGALKSGINVGNLIAFNQLTSDVVNLAANAGICASQDALALSHSASDLERIARISETRQGATAAVLKILGRDAFVMPDDKKLGFMSWMGGGIAYLLLGAIVLLVALRRGSGR